MTLNIDDLQKERAYVADEHKAWLQRLNRDLKVFSTQLDAWAFAAAFAMSMSPQENLPPTPKKKEYFSSSLQPLSAGLLTALLEADNYLASTSEWEIVKEARPAAQRLSDWASLGLSLLEKEWEGRGREQVRRMVLNQISHSA